MIYKRAIARKKLILKTVKKSRILDSYTNFNIICQSNIWYTNIFNNLINFKNTIK